MTIIEYITTYWIPISLLIVLASIVWSAFNWKGRLKYIWMGLAFGLVYAFALDSFFYIFVSDDNFLLWAFYLIYSLPVLCSYLIFLLLSVFLRKIWLNNLLRILFIATLVEGLTVFSFLLFDFRPLQFLHD